MYLNKAIVIGNLTRDPELTSLPSGQKVCKLGMATNRVWKDKNGTKQESVTYHNIVVWGKQGEISAQYLKKGQQVLVEGRIDNRSWDDKTTGEKRYRTEIIADRVQFGAKSGNSSANAGAQNAGPEKTSGAKDSEEVDTIEYPEESINPEDIPF